MPKGKLIVFEGLDCCFKETQSKMLLYSLKDKITNVHLLSFPKYTSSSGQIVYDLLHGGFGNISQLPIQFISDLYSIDRACTWFSEYKQLYDNGDVLIIDRYTYSNCIYQGVRISDESVDSDFRDVEIQNYMIGVMNKEFNVYKLPRPDVVIHMNMSIENTVKLLRDKKDKDINENNIEFLKKCKEMESRFYSTVMKDDQSIHHINCEDSQKNIRTREDIHNDILKIVY